MTSTSTAICCGSLMVNNPWRYNLLECLEKVTGVIEWRKRSLFWMNMQYISLKSDSIYIFLRAQRITREWLRSVVKRHFLQLVFSCMIVYCAAFSLLSVYKTCLHTCKLHLWHKPIILNVTAKFWSSIQFRIRQYIAEFFLKVTEI